MNVVLAKSLNLSLNLRFISVSIIFTLNVIRKIWEPTCKDERQICSSNHKIIRLDRTFFETTLQIYGNLR